MKFSDLTPGTYPATLTDWALQDVPKLANYEVVLTFAIGESKVVGYWKGLVTTKSGDANKKTARTLVTCGFKYDDYNALSIHGDALNNKETYEITIEKDGEYNRIEWVNIPGLSVSKKAKTSTMKKDPKLAKALADARRELDLEPKTDLPF